jgi:alcohol dehydrogenase class IV
MAFMEPRAPDAIASLAAAIGCEPGQIEARILQLGGDPPGLGAAGAAHAKLDEALDAMLQRPELSFNPQPPTRPELAELIERAW